MPRFFFDLSTPDRLERDETGSVFDSLEMAYLDGSQAAIDISIDMLRKREDPSRHRFEVRDETDQVVLEIPFGEVLRPGRFATPRAGPPGLHARLEATLDRNRALKSELALALADARKDLVAVAIERGHTHAGRRVPKEHIWVLGDTPRDIEAAHASGAQAVGVATGSFSEADLRNAGADVVVPDLEAWVDRANEASRV